MIFTESVTMKINKLFITKGKCKNLLDGKPVMFE